MRTILALLTATAALAAFAGCMGGDENPAGGPGDTTDDCLTDGTMTTGNSTGGNGTGANGTGTNGTDTNCPPAGTNTTYGP